MLAAFDFGISNTDVAIFSENSVKYFTAPSSKEKITTNLIKKILFDLALPISKVEVLGVTGGKSSDLEDSLGGIEIIKINEIEAIGLGAKNYMVWKMSLPSLSVQEQEQLVFMLKEKALIILAELRLVGVC